jgi:hypothetical protein
MDAVVLRDFSLTGGNTLLFREPLRHPGRERLEVGRLESRKHQAFIPLLRLGSLPTSAIDAVLCSAGNRLVVHATKFQQERTTIRHIDRLASSDSENPMIQVSRQKNMPFALAGPIVVGDFFSNPPLDSCRLAKLRPSPKMILF